MKQKHIVLILGLILLVGFSLAGFDYFQQQAGKASTTDSSNDKLSSFSQTNPLSGQSQTSLSPTPADIMSTSMDQASTSSQTVRHYDSYPGDLPLSQRTNKKAIIDTDKGQITLKIYPEATKSASNFIFLAQHHFYDDLTFHRVVPGFVIQGGDPKGDGTGGPGYQFSDDPVTRSYTTGTVAMANAGPNTNGSQFFIMLADHPELPPDYSIFGQVTSGQDVVDKIQVGDRIKTITIK
ncbi:peptidylprolyl isomerase [Patescibacteria group bacterium]|nr:peptidylprolyl isomerase [Patescibacteria group bacterium]MCL5409888.1 peptidylprolyl isomerase [Patescibacteria group bacterium]